MVLLQLDYLSPIANIEEYILFMTTFPRRDQGTPEGGKIFYNIGYTIHIRSIATFWSSAFSLPIRFFSNVFQLSSSSFGISLVFLLWTVTAVRAWITDSRCFKNTAFDLRTFLVTFIFSPKVPASREFFSVVEILRSCSFCSFIWLPRTAPGVFETTLVQAEFWVHLGHSCKIGNASFLGWKV